MAIFFCRAAWRGGVVCRRQMTKMRKHLKIKYLCLCLFLFLCLCLCLCLYARVGARGCDRVRARVRAQAPARVIPPPHVDMKTHQKKNKKNILLIQKKFIFELKKIRLPLYFDLLLTQKSRGIFFSQPWQNHFFCKGSKKKETRQNKCHLFFREKSHLHLCNFSCICVNLYKMLFRFTNIL